MAYQWVATKKMDGCHGVISLVLISICFSYSKQTMENTYANPDGPGNFENFGNLPSHHESFRELTSEIAQQRHCHHHHPRPPSSTQRSPSDGIQVRSTSRDSETSDDYPYEEVRSFLQNNPVLRDYFKVNSETVQIGMRGGLPNDDEEGISLCKTREYRLIYPQRLQNVNNMWRTIINIQAEYEQGIEVKRCHSEGTKCDHLESLPYGFTSYCSQQYITKELMVFNHTKAFDVFRFPSCCLCKIKRQQN